MFIKDGELNHGILDIRQQQWSLFAFWPVFGYGTSPQLEIILTSEKSVFKMDGKCLKPVEKAEPKIRKNLQVATSIPPGMVIEMLEKLEDKAYLEKSAKILADAIAATKDMES